MEIEDTPQSPQLNQRGNVYCHSCKIWTKIKPVVGGIRCENCMLLIKPINADPSANSTLKFSDGEIDQKYTTPSTSPPSGDKDAYEMANPLPHTSRTPEKSTNKPTKKPSIKLLRNPTKRNLFMNSSPIKMEHQHGIFEDEGYYDAHIPRENLQLPSFSIDESDNVDALVEKLKMYCKLKGINEQGKLDRIPFCLTGRAFTLFSNLTLL